MLTYSLAQACTGSLDLAQKTGFAHLLSPSLHFAEVPLHWQSAELVESWIPVPLLSRTQILHPTNLLQVLVEEYLHYARFQQRLLLLSWLLFFLFLFYLLLFLSPLWITQSWRLHITSYTKSMAKYIKACASKKWIIQPNHAINATIVDITDWHHSFKISTESYSITNMNIQKTWDEVTSIRWKRGNEPVCSTTSCTTGTGTASVFASPWPPWKKETNTYNWSMFTTYKVYHLLYSTPISFSVGQSNVLYLDSATPLSSPSQTYDKEQDEIEFSALTRMALRSVSE